MAKITAHTPQCHHDSECIRNSDSAVLPWGRGSLQRRVVTGGRPVGGVRARESAQTSERREIAACPHVGNLHRHTFLNRR